MSRYSRINEFEPIFGSSSVLERLESQSVSNSLVQWGTFLMREQQTPVVADLDLLRSWGWSDEQIVQAAIDVRYETIKGLSPEHQPTLETWLPIFPNNPDGWRFLVTAQSTAVGMWHFISLTPSAFAAMVGGRLTHSKITLAMTRPLQEKGWHDIYIVTACLKPQ